MLAPKARSRFRPLPALVILIAAAILAFPPTALAKRTLGLSTGSFEFNVAPGQTGTGDLFVTNDGNEPLKVMVYAGNQVVDAKGNTTYVVPTRDNVNLLTSPASWISVQLPVSSKSIGNVPYIELKPGEKVPVKFSFEVPKGVAPGDHQLLLFFEMFQFPGEQKAVTSNISGRLGARIRLRVQGQFDERVDVRPFSVGSLVIGDTLPYSFVVRNDGNLDKLMSVKLTAVNGDEADVASSQVVTETTVYSKSVLERSGNLSLAGLSPGMYTIRLDASYTKESGGQQVPASITKDRTVWLVPLWLAIAVIVVVGLIVLWILWRITVAAARRRANAPPRRRRWISGKAARRAPAPEVNGTGDAD
jgi:hypothetical protein